MKAIEVLVPIVQEAYPDLNVEIISGAIYAFPPHSDVAVSAVSVENGVVRAYKMKPDAPATSISLGDPELLQKLRGFFNESD